MRAFRLFGPNDTRLVDIAVPEPCPGEVLLRIRAVGVCHSDLHVREGAAGGAWALPFTLGHEVCGVVEECGSSVDPVNLGRQVLVHGPVGCSNCRRCAEGAENLCDHRATVGAAGVGLGRDGGMAEFMVTDAHRLVPADGLDPVAAAPLTDAALTSLHAIRGCGLLHPVPVSVSDPANANAVAVVIGAGGLGHVAIRMLRALTAATVVAVDSRTAALDLAVRAGANRTVQAGPLAEEAIRQITGDRGADVVLDFVAVDTTAALGAAALAAGGDLVLIGGGGGGLDVRKPGALPPDARVSVPYWGTRDELVEVVALARRGVAVAETTPFGLDDAAQALSALERGEIIGRAVLVP